MKIRQNAAHRDDRNLERAEGGGIKVCVCGYVCAEGVRFTDAIEDIQFSARWVHSERGTEWNFISSSIEMKLIRDIFYKN